MSYVLLDSTETVQVFGPTTVADALLCTIFSQPSGSTLVRTVPATEFQADHGQGILASLSDAVEQILEAGVATAATGTQGIDDSGLLYDAVIFTVTYTPSTAVPGSITATVEVPVNVITADTSFGGSLAGGSAADRINATYQKLAAMATG